MLFVFFALRVLITLLVAFKCCYNSSHTLILQNAVDKAWRCRFEIKISFVVWEKSSNEWNSLCVNSFYK